MMKKHLPLILLTVCTIGSLNADWFSERWESVEKPLTNIVVRPAGDAPRAPSRRITTIQPSNLTRIQSWQTRIKFIQSRIIGRKRQLDNVSQKIAILQKIKSQPSKLLVKKLQMEKKQIEKDIEKDRRQLAVLKRKMSQV